MSVYRRKVRKNGCQLPLNNWQLSAAVVFFGLAGTFHGIFVGVLKQNRDMQISCILAHSITGVFVIFLTLVASFIDPADRGMDEENHIQGNYCALCRKVVHKDSKHCRTCDKVKMIF